MTEFTDQEQLRAILSAMLFEVYPENSKNIICALKKMTKEICADIKISLEKKCSEEDMMTAIAMSLVFLAVHGDV